QDAADRRQPQPRGACVESARRDRHRRQAHGQDLDSAREEPMKAKMILCVLFGLGAIGCGSAQVPADKMAASEASIRAADEVGAKNVRTAALHLQFAKEQVEQAKKLIADDDNERARWVLMRAEADAELALVLAREQSMRDAAQKALQQVQEVRQKGSVAQ